MKNTTIIHGVIFEFAYDYLYIHLNNVKNEIYHLDISIDRELITVNYDGHECIYPIHQATTSIIFNNKTTNNIKIIRVDIEESNNKNHITFNSFNVRSFYYRGNKSGVAVFGLKCSQIETLFLNDIYNLDFENTYFKFIYNDDMNRPLNVLHLKKCKCVSVRNRLGKICVNQLIIEDSFIKSLIDIVVHDFYIKIDDKDIDDPITTNNIQFKLAFPELFNLLLRQNSYYNTLDELSFDGKFLDYVIQEVI